MVAFCVIKDGGGHCLPFLYFNVFFVGECEVVTFPLLVFSMFLFVGGRGAAYLSLLVFSMVSLLASVRW